MSKLDEYKNEVDKMQRMCTNWRYGQCCFNKLWEMYPKIAEEIRGTSLDPFYFTTPSHAFWAYVTEQLEKYE